MPDSVARSLVRRPPARQPYQASEAEFQDAVTSLAAYSGWRHQYHSFDSRKSAGKGFPDWVFLRHPRVIFAELKKEGEKPTREQLDWLDELSQCDGVEVYLWFPSDMEQIRRILARDWRDHLDEMAAR